MIPLRDFQFTPAQRRLVGTGLLGWASFRVGDHLVIDGVAVRRTRAGRLKLSFPARRDSRGREHPYLRPTCERARREIERAVLAELRLEGAK